MICSQPAAGRLPQHGHAHGGDRAPQALHVADLHVDPRVALHRVGPGREREERGDGPGLQQPERALGVVGELDVLRAAEGALDPLPGRLELAELVGGEAAVLLCPGERTLAGQDVVVGVHGAVHDSGAQPRDRVDDGLRAGAGQRVGREHHPGGRRGDHALHDDGHREVAGLQPLTGPVGDGALAVHGVPALPDGLEQCVPALDVEDGVLLAREAGVRQVLGRGAGADGDGTTAEVLVGRQHRPLGDGARAVGLGGQAEPVRHALARGQEGSETDRLAPDERGGRRGDVGQVDHVHGMPLWCPGAGGRCRTGSAMGRPVARSQPMIRSADRQVNLPVP